MARPGHFEGTEWFFKAGRFLHLIEDDEPAVSLSGITLWATTLNNLHAIALTHDQTQMLYGTLAHAAGMVGHAVKRWQKWKLRL